MKPITCLVAATIDGALTAPVHVHADCANWNAAAFFFVGARQLARLIYCSSIHSIEAPQRKLVANVSMVPIIVKFSDSPADRLPRGTRRTS